MARIPKKGIADQFGGVIIGIAILVIVLAVVAIMLGAFRDDLTANSAEYNVTTQGLDFLLNATDKFDTAGTIVGVLVLLAILGLGGFLGFQAFQRVRSR